jgi:zinc/manganese transport system permease protein
MDLSLFLPPLVACLVIVAIHSYLGLHVIAREVIFVDLSLAQMAALGSAVAILAGSQPDSTTALLWALGFTTLGAALFALTRTDERGVVPQEAIIGIVYVVASAAARRSRTSWSAACCGWTGPRSRAWRGSMR